MSKFKLTPQAELDLENIYDYSVENWGYPRADRYIYDLEIAFTKLSQNQLQGRTASYIKPGYFCYSVGSHVIFYRQSTDFLLVVRLLHKSMDFQRHL
ncbi:type II toxin-antitoxin system RelE/ParE family toxin [Marinibactrum halimedae]|uniref:Toxin n=1 Tax=Marinibactrum halimedae TaxID=1444977 RepID=A0AA37T5L4_9GAMM|nr:type II toxin-antitoxin system RelE/ParE family toxin [Marinibactrum halimedae]MCD9458879.1 type II toxin-antitoxin system RelE/ParE family toxin [Marinibactrum halimedae]GLS27728.1 plasmid stabilization protein ParE [Marinibactrum halimedae]